MFDDLAEHILLYLVSRVSGCTVDGVVNAEVSQDDANWMWSVSDWTEEEVTSMKKSVIILMSAAGKVGTGKFEVVSDYRCVYLIVTPLQTQPITGVLLSCLTNSRLVLSKERSGSNVAKLLHVQLSFDQ